MIKMALFKLRKIHEDKDYVICDQIQIVGDSGEVTFKDRRGFTIMTINPSGDVGVKGRVNKI